jgi:hypothetical protein
VIWVLLRKLVFRIVSRMAVRAAWLTAGVKFQNRLPRLEFFTNRGRKPYPRKSNAWLSWLSFRLPSLQ